MVNPRKKGPDVKLMVWGCFWGERAGPIVPVGLLPVNLDGDIYHNMLKALLPDVVTDCQQATSGAYFQQDNVPVHTTFSTMVWLQQQRIQTLPFPPHSPDLAPIEHAWKRLKEELQKNFPDIVNYPGGPPAVKKRLAEILPDLWFGIQKEFWKSLYTSMPRRIRAVVRAGGWYTKY